MPKKKQKEKQGKISLTKIIIIIIIIMFYTHSTFKHEIRRCSDTQFFSRQMKSRLNAGGCGSL